MKHDDATIAEIVLDAFADVFGRRPRDEDEVMAFVKSCLRLKHASDPSILTTMFRQRHGRHPRDVGEFAEWVAERTSMRH